MKRFIGIVQFLTRIPVPVDTGFDEEFYKSTVYFPLVGLVLGCFYFIIGKLSSLIFPAFITSLIIVGTTVILTGGLHLDGVGDTFDGIYSYRDKERILEIMKDSRLGTNALLAILFVLLFKIGFVYYLVEQNQFWQLLIMPMVARLFQIIACYKTKTPREKGMGNLFIGKVSTKRLLVTLGYTSVIIVAILLLNTTNWTFYLMAYGTLLLVLVVGLKYFIGTIYKKIDGITGDILGAICEGTEVFYLMGAHIVTYCLTKL